MEKIHVCRSTFMLPRTSLLPASRGKLTFVVGGYIQLSSAITATTMDRTISEHCPVMVTVKCEVTETTDGAEMGTQPQTIEDRIKTEPYDATWDSTGSAVKLELKTEEINLDCECVELSKDNSCSEDDNTDEECDGEKEEKTLLMADDKIHKCEICDRRFSRSFGLNRHMLAHTGYKQHKCKTCDRSFLEKGTLRRHLLTHVGKTLYRCQVCDGNFSPTFFSDGTRVCRWCMTRFRDKPDMLKQIGDNTDDEKHFEQSGENPYKCKICNKRYSLKRNLRTHMMTHTSEKRHKCTICAKPFLHYYALKRHLLMHEGKRPHQCATCGSKFASERTLTRHMLTHSGEKPHKCTVCPWQFSQKSHLNAHVLMHTGETTFTPAREKKHKCQVCQKLFVQERTLNLHMLSHNGEKPHTCALCGGKFTRRCALDRHMLMHTDEKSYECKVCEIKFGKMSFYRHLLIHGDGSEHTGEQSPNVRVNTQPHSDESVDPA